MFYCNICYCYLKVKYCKTAYQLHTHTKISDNITLFFAWSFDHNKLYLWQYWHWATFPWLNLYLHAPVALALVWHQSQHWGCTQRCWDQTKVAPPASGLTRKWQSSLLPCLGEVFGGTSAPLSLVSIPMFWKRVRQLIMSKCVQCDKECVLS